MIAYKSFMQEVVKVAELNMEKAKEIYAVMCSMLDNEDWHYEKKEEDLVIKSGVRGDNLPIEFIMRVNPRNEIVSFMSWLPFKVEESKLVDIAVATCIVNYALVDGSFDFDMSDGSVMFRLTSSYKASTLGEELFKYMLMAALTTVDEYSSKFFMISKGMMSIEQFIASEKESK